MRTTTEATRLMLQVKAIESSAHLELSEYTGQWYVEARIELSDNVILAGITEHRDTPDDAVKAFFDRLVGVPFDQVIVTNAYQPNRRQWRWNGAAFSEVPV